MLHTPDGLVTGTDFHAVPALLPPCGSPCDLRSTIHYLRTVCSMLAPYAAVLYKYQQMQSTRAMLEQLLPPRVVAAAIDRLSIGGNSAVDLFVPTHHEMQPDG